jgi:hypothetical protein
VNIWVGGWTAIAMALCGDAAGWAGRGAFGDAARAQRFQDHAGQDRPQGCTWDCRADAAGMVPAGALQVDGSPGDARHADRAQTGAEGAPGNWIEPVRHSAWLRPEGRQDDTGGVRGAYQGACCRTSKSGGHYIRAAFGARGAPASVQRLSRSGCWRSRASIRGHGC